MFAFMFVCTGNTSWRPGRQTTIVTMIMNFEFWIVAGMWSIIARLQDMIRVNKIKHNRLSYLYYHLIHFELTKSCILIQNKNTYKGYKTDDDVCKGMNSTNLSIYQFCLVLMWMKSHVALEWMNQWINNRLTLTGLVIYFIDWFQVFVETS